MFNGVWLECEGDEEYQYCEPVGDEDPFEPSYEEALKIVLGDKTKRQRKRKR